MSSTANATRRIPRVFAGAFRSPPRAGGAWNFISSSRPWPSEVSNIAMSTRTPSSPTTRVHPTALNRPLTQHLESELDEERRRGREVVDHDAHVLQALNRHALDGSNTAAQLSWRLLTCGGLGNSRLGAEVRTSRGHQGSGATRQPERGRPRRCPGLRRVLVRAPVLALTTATGAICSSVLMGSTSSTSPSGAAATSGHSLVEHRVGGATASLRRSPADSARCGQEPACPYPWAARP